MSNSTLFIAWMLVFYAALMLPYKRGCRHNGYIWRALKKVYPFRFWLTDSLNHFCCRYFTYSAILLGIQLLFLPGRAGYAEYWGGLAITYIDDYYNGDDDERKKRWETIKNKVKWVTPKPAPAKVKVRA